MVGDHEIKQIMVKNLLGSEKNIFFEAFKNLHDPFDLHDLNYFWGSMDKKHWIVLARDGTYRQRREFRVDAQYCIVTEQGVAFYHDDGTLALFLPHNRIDIVFFPGLIEP